MTIRVPSMTEEEARTMGETVAGKIAAMLPSDLAGKNIDELKIQISFKPGTNPEIMSTSIATQILQQLKMI